MYEKNQVLFDTRTSPITRHVIDEKVKVVDGDGNEQYLYHLTGYGVYFTEKQLISDFSVIVEGEE